MNKQKETISVFNKHAKAYNEKFGQIKLYDESYNLFCSLIQKPNAKIFEIGCDPGNITKYLLSKREDLIITGIDLAPAMIQIAKENNPTANFFVMDCKEINSIKEKFDGIICGFILPYLSKDEACKLIQDCFSLLNANGIFYFSLIEGNYDKSAYETSSDGKDKCYVYYYDENYWRALLKENNFELIELKRIGYEKGNGIADTHLVFVAIPIAHIE